MRAIIFIVTYCLFSGISAFSSQQVQEAGALWRRGSSPRDRPSSSNDRQEREPPKGVKYERPRAPVDLTRPRIHRPLLQPIQAEPDSPSRKRNQPPARPIRITRPSDTLDAPPGPSRQSSQSRSSNLIPQQPSILTLERPKQAPRSPNPIFQEVSTSHRKEATDPRASLSSSKKIPTKNDSGWTRSNAITSEQVSRSMARSKERHTHQARHDQDSSTSNAFSALEVSRPPSPDRQSRASISDEESREPSPVQVSKPKPKPPPSKPASQNMIAQSSASQQKWIPPPRRPEDGLRWGEDWKTQHIPYEGEPKTSAGIIRPGSPPRGYLIPGDREIAATRMREKPGQWAHAVVTAWGPAHVSAEKPSESTPHIQSQDGHEIQVEAHDPDFTRLRAGGLSRTSAREGLVKAKVKGKYVRGSFSVGPDGFAYYKHTCEAGVVSARTVTIGDKKYSNCVSQSFGNTQGKMQTLQATTHGDVLLDMSASQRPFEEYEA